MDRGTQLVTSAAVGMVYALASAVVAAYAAGVASILTFGLDDVPEPWDTAWRVAVGVAAVVGFGTGARVAWWSAGRGHRHE